MKIKRIVRMEYIGKGSQMETYRYIYRFVRILSYTHMYIYIILKPRVDTNDEVDPLCRIDI